MKPGSGAETAGVRPTTKDEQGDFVLGDVIQAIDGHAVRRQEDVERIIGKHQPGDEVKLTIRRQGEQQDVTVTLGGV